MTIRVAEKNIYKDNPLFANVLANIEVYRRKLDAPMAENYRKLE